MLNPVARGLISALSPAGARARLSILIFHRVLRERDPLFPSEVTAAEFDAICSWLRDWFDVLPLGDAVARLRQDRLPARALAITFDDGYADNHDVALPILQRHGLSATFFVATRFLDGGRMWNDTLIEAVRGVTGPGLELAGTPAAAVGPLSCGSLEERRRAIGTLIGATKYLAPPERDAWVDAVAAASGAAMPSDLMMSSAQVRALRAAGQEIGAHTDSHPILARLSPMQMEQEIRTGRERLEGLLGERVALFAYPNGQPGTDYTPEAVEIVRRLGFDAAVSTAWGAARRGADRFQLPRFTPWDRSRLRFGARLAANLWSR